MNIEEVKKRPIMTILSGPAAGVAGALMYEKLTDGLFFEVGGTSTDISCVKDGKVMIKYAEVGGHKTYLNSLDVKTVGIGGGSMIQIENGEIVDTGPRSAHIAGIDYEIFADPSEIVNPVLKKIKPMKNDPYYGYVECENGKKFCFTLTGAANILGYIGEKDYARGNIESAKLVWNVLAESMGISIEKAAQMAMDFAFKKNMIVVEEIIKEYKLNKESIVFVGGGGGASAVVPHLAKTGGYKFKIAKNAPVISTIGVALAMVREVVERTIADPTEEDIITVRNEAKEAILKSGAEPSTIEISIEVDQQRNIVRAIATGSTEMRTKDLGKQNLNIEELLDIVASNLNVEKNKLEIEAKNEKFYAVSYKKKEKSFLFFNKILNNVRLIDNEGVIRLQKNNAQVFSSKKTKYKEMLNNILNSNTSYGDGGIELPNIFIATESKLIDLTSLSTSKQIISLADIELAAVSEETTLIYIVTNRSDT